MPVPVDQPENPDSPETIGYALPRPMHRVWLWEPDKRDAFRSGLIDLLNIHGADGQTDTPDYVLADFIMTCMNAYDDARARRDVCRS
jgi:hypothetical protein